MGHDTLQDPLGKEVVGMAEMRTRQAEVMDMVSNHFSTVYLRDNKRNACSRTAVLVHPELIDTMLSNWTFNSIIEKKKTYQIIRVEELGAEGRGETREKAVENLVTDVIRQTRAFFAEMDLHARLPETRMRYPYYLKILQCRSEKAIIKILDIDGEE